LAWGIVSLDWQRKSQRQPKISPQTIALIRKMAKENPLWGAERIRGELLKLGIKVSKWSIQKYLPREKPYLQTRLGHPSSRIKPTRVWACDFTVVYDCLFQQSYVFVVLELKTWQIIHARVTKYPTDEWTAQQVREATGWGGGPKYLLHDRDSEYGTHFSAVAIGSNITEMKTLYRTPQADGICERFMESLRREFLDHTLIHHDQHLQQVINEYIAYFNW
jgi:transposase InsO family protein